MMDWGPRAVVQLIAFASTLGFSLWLSLPSDAGLDLTAVSFGVVCGVTGLDLLSERVMGLYTHITIALLRGLSEAEEAQMSVRSVYSSLALVSTLLLTLSVSMPQVDFKSDAGQTTSHAYVSLLGLAFLY